MVWCLADLSVDDSPRHEHSVESVVSSRALQPWSRRVGDRPSRLGQERKQLCELGEDEGDGNTDE